MLSALSLSAVWLAVCLPLLLASALLGAPCACCGAGLRAARLRGTAAWRLAACRGAGQLQPVYVRDAAQRLITCNRRYEELVGASRGSLRGLPPDTGAHRRDRRSRRGTVRGLP
ncbi:hypothetical protein ACTMU2_20350 [Cupriavidus basilensis]